MSAAVVVGCCSFPELESVGAGSLRSSTTCGTVGTTGVGTFAEPSGGEACRESSEGVGDVGGAGVSAAFWTVSTGRSGCDDDSRVGSLGGGGSGDGAGTAGVCVPDLAM